MTETYVMEGRTRAKSSKGATKQLRQDGFIPAVIYGAGKEADSIAVSSHSIMMAMQKGGFFTNPQEIEIDGKKVKVLPRDLQREPVYDRVIHADFLRFDASRELKVMVRMHIVDEDKSPGIKKGGIVSLVRNEVELVCRADSIPDYLEISVAGLDVGQSSHFSIVELPEGVRSTITDRDFTVATILATRSSTLSDLDADGAEGAEGEESTEEAATE